MGEVIKHGLIQDKDYFEFIVSHKLEISKLAPKTLIELIYRSCLIKSRVVEIDPKEKGIRAYLNFGHTIGHAIEKLSDYKLYHGQCVALGMVASLYISKIKGFIDDSQLEDAIETIRYFNLPTSIDGDMYNVNSILETTKSDKKMENNKIKFIVLRNIGEAVISREIDDELIIRGIEYIIK